MDRHIIFENSFFPPRYFFLSGSYESSWDPNNSQQEEATAAKARKKRYCCKMGRKLRMRNLLGLLFCVFMIPMDCQVDTTRQQEEEASKTYSNSTNDVKVDKEAIRKRRGFHLPRDRLSEAVLIHDVKMVMVRRGAYRLKSQLTCSTLPYLVFRFAFSLTFNTLLPFQSLIHAHNEEILSSQSPLDLRRRDELGRSPLHICGLDPQSKSKPAVDVDCARISNMLVEVGFPVNDRCNAGWSALDTYATLGLPETVNVLLDLGASVDAADKEFGRTALMKSAINGK